MQDQLLTVSVLVQDQLLTVWVMLLFMECQVVVQVFLRKKKYFSHAGPSIEWVRNVVVCAVRC